MGGAAPRDLHPFGKQVSSSTGSIYRVSSGFFPGDTRCDGRGTRSAANGFEFNYKTTQYGYLRENHPAPNQPHSAQNQSHPKKIHPHKEMMESPQNSTGNTWVMVRGVRGTDGSPIVRPRSAKGPQGGIFRRTRHSPKGTHPLQRHHGTGVIQGIHGGLLPSRPMQVSSPKRTSRGVKQGFPKGLQPLLHSFPRRAAGIRSTVVTLVKPSLRAGVV